MQLIQNDKFEGMCFFVFVFVYDAVDYMALDLNKIAITVN